MRTRDYGLDRVLELPNSAKTERAANQGYPLISLTRCLIKTTSRKEGAMGRSAHLTLTAYRSTVHSSSHQVLGALPSLTHLTRSASVRFSTPAPLLARTSRSLDSVHNRPVLRYLQPRNFTESGYNPVMGTEHSAFQGCARRSPIMDRSLSSVVGMRQ